MKIFSAAQLKKWDAFTITHEPITSINLMERAAEACCNWLLLQNFKEHHFHIFCGKGNNGGDGLAIARLLIQNHCRVTTYIIELGKSGTDDFQTNLERLHQCSTDIHFIQSPEFFPVIPDGDIVIDAIFGTGLNKPPGEITADLINHINSFAATIISIDLPSGMFADSSAKGNAVIRATYTLSFQHYKLAFLLPENESYCGDVRLLDIGLHPFFEKEENAAFEITGIEQVRDIYRPRTKFAHKGTYGHAALVAGSYGMMGAAVLAARACLRSGAGKLSCYIPKCGYTIVQTAVPEAMCIVAGEEHILSAPGIGKFDTAGIGPGIGMQPTNSALLHEIFAKLNTPLLIDADALNTIAKDKTLLKSIPPHSILAPHPGEFERLFGPVKDDFERLQLARQKSKELNVYIILKGHYSFISTPLRTGYFNPTGNPGMATAGSGDVLSGILTGLLAQGYDPLQACILGTWLHGLAGDIAAAELSEEALIAGDIIDRLGDAFKKILA